MDHGEVEWWSQQLQDCGLDELIHRQEGVLSRKQWLHAGGSINDLRRYLRRPWSAVFPGVYFTEPGRRTQTARAIAGLLYAGPGAMWSHGTAAQQWGLRQQTDDGRIDLLIPRGRRVRRQPGLQVHTSAYAIRRRAAVLPPRVTRAHAVLDLVDDCKHLDEALAVVADSCQTGRVRLDEVLATLAGRPVRWSRELRSAAGYLSGSDSLLEVRYVRDVEAAHNLPRSTRQRRQDDDIADCAYDGYRLLVELDGRVHLPSDRRWRDMRRDNRSTLRGEATLRYGFLEVSEHACNVAVQVLLVLRVNGFAGEVRPCGPRCPVR